jgi:hypothetical protein
LSTMLLVRLLMCAKQSLSKLPNVVDVKFAKRLTIVGDLHGQVCHTFWHSHSLGHLRLAI